MTSSALASLDPWLRSVRDQVDAEIERRIGWLANTVEPRDSAADALIEAIRYGVLGPGKRLRPALAIAAAGAVGGNGDVALPVAASVEMLHAYTLIHDDLPAMDDDDERRGRPTVHVRFGEAVAILAGDALLTLAFATLADLDERCADAVAVLGRRAGPTELLLGQARDIDAERRQLSIEFEELERIHRHKTGALFAAAAELGAISANASADQRSALAELGMAVGLAFQHADDRLDGEHAAFRERASERAAALAARARELASGLAGDDSPLAALVECIALR